MKPYALSGRIYWLTSTGREFREVDAGWDVPDVIGEVKRLSTVFEVVWADVTMKPANGSGRVRAAVDVDAGGVTWRRMVTDGTW